MKDKLYDFLIIGQGLAGSILADVLQYRGQSVYLIDDRHHSSASIQAAGIINPITGRRFVKSWMFDRLYHRAISYYHWIEERSQVNILKPLPILRILKTAGEENDWISRSARKGWESYMYHRPYLQLDYLKTDHLSLGEIRKSVTVQITALLDYLKKKFTAEACLDHTTFVHAALSRTNDLWVYKDNKFKAVVFAEGYQIAANPYFNYLPLIPTKGEFLVIRCPSLPKDYMIKSELMIVPLQNDTFWVGATYEWDFDFDRPSKQAYMSLTSKLDRVLKLPFQILYHASGIRPTVKDRRPLLGEHPAHPTIFVFNGFGTKGASLIPWMTEHMCDFLLEGSPLMEEVTIRRFLKE